MTPSIETRSTAGLLALTALRGVGAVTAERIAHQFESLEEIASAAPACLCEVASQAVAKYRANSRHEAHAAFGATGIVLKTEIFRAIGLFRSRWGLHPDNCSTALCFAY